MAARGDIDLVLSALPEFQEVTRVSEVTALWDVMVAVDGCPPVRLLVDNGINDLYLQALLRDLSLDENPSLLLEVASDYGVVGLISFGDDLYLRAGCFLEFSDVGAITNTLLAVVYAFHDYRRRLTT